LFSSPQTPTDSLCAGIALCPPNTGHLCAHRHAQAELYYIIEGNGIVVIDGIESKVEKGSTVFIPGNAEHEIRNVADTELRWFYVFPTGSFGDVVYRFSDEEKMKSRL
jgi:mannose-6-phosphate isomerase-like protein (cupin superfamily)